MSRGVNIQFHARDTECVQLVKECCQEFGLKLLLVQYSPTLKVRKIMLFSDKTRSRNTLKLTLLISSVFLIMFSSFGSIADGYGCLMLLTCSDCALFQSHISTILFLLLFIECIGRVFH